ncbi:MAG: glycoside hydrolase domain-containing protein, partial [Phocaeicola sp.]
SPTFERMTLNLENSKQFTIIAPGASGKQIYIQSAKLNGESFNRNYLTHQEIMAGGTIEFVMGDTPNKAWASLEESCPPDVTK